LLITIKNICCWHTWCSCTFVIKNLLRFLATTAINNQNWNDKEQSSTRNDDNKKPSFHHVCVCNIERICTYCKHLVTNVRIAHNTIVAHVNLNWLNGWGWIAICEASKELLEELCTKYNVTWLCSCQAVDLKLTSITNGHSESSNWNIYVGCCVAWELELKSIIIVGFVAWACVW